MSAAPAPGEEEETSYLPSSQPEARLVTSLSVVPIVPGTLKANPRDQSPFRTLKSHKGGWLLTSPLHPGSTSLAAQTAGILTVFPVISCSPHP